MFEDYYLNNPELQGLLAGLDLGGLGGQTGGAIQDPNVQYVTAPVSNKGNPTSKTSGNVFAVATDQPVRLVDLRTNEVVFEGTGVEAARKATELGQNLTNTLGNKASYNIQTANPSGEYTTVANEKKNKSVLGQIADVALPIAAGFIPGVGPVLGAALGSAASSVAQGRSLENTLLRAGLSAGGSALGGQLFGQVAPGASAPMTGINADLIPNALQGLSFGSLTGASIPAGVGGAAGDIIVNAARAAAPSLVGSAAGSALGSVPSFVGTSPSTPDEIVVSGRRPVEPNLGETLGPIGSLINPLPSAPDEIVVTGQRPQEPNLGGTIGGVVGGAIGGLPFGPTTPTTPTNNDGVLGTGLTIPQLLSIGGIGADLLQNLISGGGGAGTGAPYVSPFGTGVGFARGQDMRVNPNIADYEQYGFGPEAMFFRPEYSGLASGAGAARPAATTAPMYQPLVGQNSQSYQQAGTPSTLAPYSTNQELSTNLLDQAANYVSPNGFTPATGTVIQTPEWDKLYFDYVTGRSQVPPPRLVGNTQEETDRRLQAAIERGPDIAQQTVDYWSAVRNDPRYASAAQYEMTTGESAGGGPYLPQGYEMVGNAVLKTGTPQYQAAIQSLLPANAPTQVPPAMTINPVYQPLI